MSEAIAYHYCPNCGVEQLFIFSGSLRKGSCLRCGLDLANQEEKPDLKKVVSYSG